jgi:hypothetical protein
MDHWMTLELASTIGIWTLWVTLLDTRLPNLCKAWGQTLQFRQRTQADNTRAEISLGRMSQEALSLTHHVRHHIIVCLFILSGNQ